MANIIALMYADIYILVQVHTYIGCKVVWSEDWTRLDTPK